MLLTEAMVRVKYPINGSIVANFYMYPYFCWREGLLHLQLLAITPYPGAPSTGSFVGVIQNGLTIKHKASL